MSRCEVVRTLPALALPILVSCGAPFPAPDSTGAGTTKISFEPSAEVSAVASVVRVRLESARLNPGEVGLFQGELSSYYLARIKSGQLPDTLVARQTPLVSWRDGGALVLAPVHALAPGGYSLASLTGLIGQFQVSTAAPLLERLWPPSSSPGAPGHAVFCGDGTAPLDLAPLDFEPGGLSITPLLGVDESGLFGARCVHFDADAALDPNALIVPPPTAGAWAVDPAPFAGVVTEPAPPLPCAENELTLGLGCARVEDDRVVVHTPASALLWVVHTPHGSVLEVTQAGGEFVLRGLSPASSERIWGSVRDESGSEQKFDAILTMAPARERPVLNEVLANALGPEPQSEWIELVNDGASAVELSHFSLRDGGGIVPLPKAALRAAEYALLVRDDYAPSALDVPPAEGARLIHVPELGKAGLSNSGESLALIAGNSLTISTLPARAAKAGESLARRHPFAPDDDPSAFTTGIPTPGAPN